MTTDFVAALVIATPPTLTALAALIAIVIATRRADRKLDHITVLTNSTLTAANKRIDELETIINTMSVQLGTAEAEHDR